MITKALSLLVIAFALAFASTANAQSAISAQDYEVHPAYFDGDYNVDYLYVSTDPVRPSFVALSAWDSPHTYVIPDMGIDFSPKSYNFIIAYFTAAYTDETPRAGILLQRKVPGDHYILRPNMAGEFIGISHTIPNIASGLAWSADQHRIQAADFNGDGLTDLFFQATSTNGVNAILLREYGCALFIWCTNQGVPQLTWSDGGSLFQGLRWSTQSAIVHVGNFNNDRKADFFVQARPKTVMIDYEIPIPVPVHAPFMNGMVFSLSSGNTAQFGDTRYYDRYSLGVDLSPLSSNLVIGYFNSDYISDILVQARTTGRTSYVFAGGANGALGTANALAIGINLSADAVRLVPAGALGVLWLQPLTADGTDRLLGGLFGTPSVSSGTGSSTMGGAPISPTSAVGRTEGFASVSASGQAGYSIPLVVPQGMGGLTPKLSLTYRSDAGNGLLGKGWSLSGLSSISRCAATFAQDGQPSGINSQISDRYCLDGNRLQLVSGQYGASGSRYRTEAETFSDVVVQSSNDYGPESFVVRKKDGLSYEYGTTTESRVQGDINGQQIIRTWTLNRVADRSGNEILFVYALTPSGTHFISSIRYGGRAGSDPAYFVGFEYDELPASTSYSQWLYGAPVNAGALALGKVVVAPHYPGVRPFAPGVDLPYDETKITRAYYFLYRYRGVGGLRRPLLNHVQECAGGFSYETGQVLQKCMAPTYFEWQPTTEGVGASEGGLGQSDAAGLTMDVDGDGYDDLAYKNTASGTLKIIWGSASGLTSETDTGVAFPYSATQFFLSGALRTDFDNDGKMDLIVAQSNDTWWWLRERGGHAFDFTDTGIAVDVVNGGPAGAMIDHNGDGYEDLVSIAADGTELRVRLHSASGSPAFEPGFQLFSAGASALENPEFRVVGIRGGSAAPRHRTMDFDGDGRHDLIAMLANGTNQLLYSDSTGFVEFGNTAGAIVPIHVNADQCTDFIAVGTGALSASKCRRNEFQPFTTLQSNLSESLRTVVDWNSDGIEDLVVRTNNQLQVLAYEPGRLGLPASFRATELGFGVPASFGVTANPDETLFTTADIDGNGRQDLITRDGSGLWRYRRNTGSSGHGLLTSVSDGFGNATSFDYKQTTPGNCYSRSTAPIVPNTHLRMQSGSRWLACSMTTTEAGRTPYTQSFTYSNARTNVRRGYAGFETRTVTDSRTQVRREETYRQDFPYVGISSQVITRDGTGTTIGATFNTTLQSREYSFVGGVTRYPYVKVAYTETFEIGGTRHGAHLSTQTATVNAIDDYGNVTDVTTKVEDKDSLIQAGQTFTNQVKQIIDNRSDTWCLGRAHRTESISTLGNGNTRSETTDRNIDYDKCRVTEQVSEPGAAHLSATPLSVITRYAFDPAACGNMSSVTVIGHRHDGTQLPPRTSHVGYGTSCLFPESVTDALGMTTTRTFDSAYGVLKSQTDPNGRTTSWEYDLFGRRVKETHPDGTSTTVAFTACNANNSYCGVADLRMRVDTVLRDTAGAPIRTSYDYLDSVGRIRVQDDPLPLGSALSHVVSTYDIQGRLESRTVPYSANYQGKTVYDYDLAGRQISAKLFDTTGTVIRQSSMRYEGRRTVSRNPRHSESIKLHDAMGQLREVIDPETAASTKYAYQFSGTDLVSTVTDSKNNAIVTTVNLIGNKVRTSDPDMGVWTFEHNSLGEMTKQTDAKGQWVVFDDYDALSRPTKRREYENASTFAESTWTYGTAAEHAYGQIKSVTDSSYTEAYDFDSLGRPAATHITMPGEPVYHINYDYEATTGQVDTVTYPASTGTPLKVKYEYTKGVQTSVKEFTNNVVGTTFWQLTATDAMGNVTGEALGNGMQVRTGYDPTTGLMTSRQSGTDSGASNRQNLAYVWDANGNLERRTDHNQNGLYERFEYDELNRLKDSYRVTSTATQNNLHMVYDDIGNIESKSDVGSYNYTTAQTGCVNNFTHTQPHAVRNAGGSSYCYDANGNMKSRSGAELTWNSDNTVRQITQGGISSKFWYTPNGDRYKQEAMYASGMETTVYIGGLVEKVRVPNGQVAYRHYIGAGSNVAIHTRWDNGTVQNFYATTDHLGSSSAITDHTGSVVVNESFDAFGKRRASDWSTAAPTPAEMQAIANTTRAGYTGHEHMDNLGLVNMNGRVQDPTLGRFLSADPHIQAPEYSQSLNRYSYVWNNPLSMIDPTGFEADPQTTCAGRDLSSEADCELEPIIVTGCNAECERRRDEYNQLRDIREFLERQQMDREILQQLGRDIVDNTINEIIQPFKDGIQTGKDVLDGDLKAAAAGLLQTGCGVAKVCRGLEKFITKVLGPVGKKLLDSIKRAGCAMCFVAGTMVVTDVGARPIETLRIGDTVLARDENTGQTAYKPITEIYVNDQGSVWELKVAFGNGATNVHEVTGNHPYWVDGQGWVAVENLTVGSYLTTETGMTAALVSKRDTGHVERTYNLEVADFHTYFVGEQRVLVHNGKREGPCQIGSQSDVDSKDIARQKGETAKSSDNALDKLAEIERAQQQVRKGQSGQIIDDITKSKQRAQHQLDRISLDDLGEFE